MRKIIITPGGRKQYLEILVKYLERDFQNGDFEKWKIWRNTTNQTDIDYINYLSEKYNNWIEVIPCPVPFQEHFSRTIHAFYKTCTEDDAIYLRLDDDIVWIEKDAIKELFYFRIKNPNYFVVFGNIINNSICGYIHQHLGAIDYSKGINGYTCMDNIGWKNNEFAEHTHRTFFKNLFYPEFYKFNKWELLGFIRFSINVMCWFGDDFKQFNNDIELDE
jgi:hypothetical protein